MNNRPIEQARSATLRGSWPALLRAAQRAREVAARTGTELIVSRNGVIERIRPEPQTSLPVGSGAVPSWDLCQANQHPVPIEPLK